MYCTGQHSAFRLTTTGSIAFLFPMSYRWAHSTANASHLVFLWVFLSVCLFCSVSMLASPPLSRPSLLLAGIHTNVFLCFDFSQTQANTHKFLFSPMLLPPTLISCSSVADRLIHWSLVHMINSCLVHFFFFSTAGLICLLSCEYEQVLDWLLCGEAKSEPQ